METEDRSLCKLCNEKTSKYTCPKCNIPYCSLDCYKSEIHLECSETFYKKCVEDELKLNESDVESQKKMLEILQRMKNEMEEDEVEDILGEDSSGSESLDSDDDDYREDLSERLKNVNLDEPEQLWAVLTDAEKQQFEALMKNGEAEKLVPDWQPWWTYHEEKKLVEELKEYEEKSYVKNCPSVKEVPKFNELSKASPYVKFNIENVLVAYVYTTLYFNGEHMESPNDAVLVFLDICDNMRCNQVFSDSMSASAAVMTRLITGAYLVDDDTFLTLKEAVNSILKGPTEEDKSFYTKVSLSDLHELFSKAKPDFSNVKGPKTDLPKKFAKSEEILKRTQFTKKELKLCVKKLEYYLSWLSCYSMT